MGLRRFVANQLVISRELGLKFCENPWQGSFIVEELTDLVEERELTRSSEEEKQAQITNLAHFQQLRGGECPQALAAMQHVAEQRGKLFAGMMEALKVASLGQVSGALYEVDGIYRRNM